MSIFDGVSNAITKALIVLGVIMVLSTIVLVVLTAMERSHAPVRLEEDDDWDQGYDTQKSKNRTQPAQQAEPDSEEIIYTRRMLALKEEPKNGHATAVPPRLPAPRRAETASASENTEAMPTRPTRQSQHSDDVADRLVQKAQSRYTESESSAAYRPVSTHVKPYVQSNPQPEQRSAPRVFDYRKQPKSQPKTKQTVTRIQKDVNFKDDEEY